MAHLERGRLTIPRKLRRSYGLEGDRAEISLVPTEGGILIRQPAQGNNPQARRKAALERQSRRRRTEKKYARRYAEWLKFRAEAEKSADPLRRLQGILPPGNPVERMGGVDNYIREIRGRDW